MGDGYVADAEVLAGQAALTLTASQTMADGWSAAQGRVVVQGAAFGNLTLSARLDAAQQQAGSALGDTTGRLVAVFENDADALYRTASTYQRAEDDAQDRLERVRARLGRPS